MTALYIILGIIAFFVLLLSVKVAVTVHYEDDVAVSIKWLFLKFNILPKSEEKRPKKEKKKKEEKAKEAVLSSQQSSLQVPHLNLRQRF